MKDFNINIIPCLNDNYSYVISVGRDALVIDPSESKPIINFIEKNNLELKFILNTHHHFDHVGGNLELKDKYNLLIAGNENDKKRIPGIDILLNETEKFLFNSHEFQVINTPGHTSDCISFYVKSMKSVFTGDAVFSLGCGRLFEGSPNEMWKSICKIKSLPDDTNIFCGHEYTMNNAIFTKAIIDNEAIDLKIREIKKLRSNNIPTIPTTIAAEKKLNIFFQADRDEIKSLFSKELINDEEAFKMIRLAKDNF